MNMIEWRTNWQEPKYWLLGIGVGLMVLHLTLMWRSDNVDMLGTSLIFWFAISLLIWDKRDALQLHSSIFSSFFGGTLILLVVLKSLGVYGYDIFLRISPFISVLGLGLVASGIKGLKQYWPELFILVLTAIPGGLVLRFVDVALITAKFTAFMMWYAGFEVKRQGINLILPTGIVEVASGCSGLNSILQLLALAVVFLFMFPTSKTQKIIVPLVAVSVGFVVNSIRVALLTLLVANSNNEAFAYWHHGDGSLIFATIAGAIFWGFCQFVILRDEPKEEVFPDNPDAGEF